MQKAQEETNLSTNPSPQNKRFLFDLSFDEGLNEDTPHILTTREIREKEESAYKNGHAAGVNDVQNSLMSAVKILLETIQAEIYALEEDNKSYRAAVAQEATHILQGLVSKFTPDLLTEHLIKDAHQQIIKWINRNDSKKSLKLIMGPQTHALMQQYVDEHQPNLNESLTIVGDPQMSESSYALKWNLGELHFSRDTLVQEISAILQNAHDGLSTKINTSIIDMTPPTSEAAKEDVETSPALPQDETHLENTNKP